LPTPRRKLLLRLRRSQWLRQWRLVFTSTRTLSDLELDEAEAAGRRLVQTTAERRLLRVVVAVLDEGQRTTTQRWLSWVRLCLLRRAVVRRDADEEAELRQLQLLLLQRQLRVPRSMQRKRQRKQQRKQRRQPRLNLQPSQRRTTNRCRNRTMNPRVTRAMMRTRANEKFNSLSKSIARTFRQVRCCVVIRSGGFGHVVVVVQPH